MAYFENNNYDSCLLLSKEIGAFCKRTSNDGLFISVLNLIGVIYQEAANYEKAIEVFTEMEPILKKSKNLYKKYIIYASIGKLHWRIKDYEKAKQFYNKSLAITKKINSDEQYLIQSELANIHAEEGDFKGAIKIVDTVSKHFDSITDFYSKNMLHYTLGNYYNRIGNPSVALNYATNFNASAESEKADLYWLLHQIYKSGDESKSFKYLQKYVALKDAIDLKSNKINEQISFAEFFVQKAQIEKEFVEKENVLIEEKNTTYFWTIIGLVTLLTIIFLLIIVLLARACGGDTAESTTLGEGEAVYYAREFVKRDLVSPATADFQSTYSMEVQELETDKWFVKGYVDSENNFGANIRTSFGCFMTYHPATDNVTLDEIIYD